MDLCPEIDLPVEMKYLKLVHQYNRFAAGAKLIKQSLFLCSHHVKTVANLLRARVLLIAKIILSG
jgi:hypothetical protein